MSCIEPLIGLLLSLSNWLFFTTAHIKYSLTIALELFLRMLFLFLLTEQPSATINPPSINYQARDNVSITCQVTGFPVPSILWYKEGILLEFDERRKPDDSSLTISNAQLSDAGEYECSVWNFVGQVRAMVKLVYTGK